HPGPAGPGLIGVVLADIRLEHPSIGHALVFRDGRLRIRPIPDVAELVLARHELADELKVALIALAQRRAGCGTRVRLTLPGAGPVPIDHRLVEDIVHEEAIEARGGS